MKIVSIINKNTKDEVCNQYKNKTVDLDKSIFVIGFPLKIAYESGSYFTHEIVKNVESDCDKIIITTTKKIWTIK